MHYIWIGLYWFGLVVFLFLSFVLGGKVYSLVQASRRRDLRWRRLEVERWRRREADALWSEYRHDVYHEALRIEYHRTLSLGDRP